MSDLSPFRVQIGQLYDGPFDLLLDLIRRQNVSIYDIPIAAITNEYLQYLATLRDLEVEIAAEFLVVAATLIQIKSKMLLPADPVVPGEPPPEDPREELVRRLIEYEAFKQAAAQLHQKQQLEAASWSRPARAGELAFIADEPGQLAVGVHDLVTTFQHVMQRLQERPRLEITSEAVTVSDMIAHLRRLLAASDEAILIRPLLEASRSRSALLATFLAVLEVVRQNLAQLRQDRPFGEIYLRRHRRFHEVWAEAQAGANSEPSPAHSGEPQAPPQTP